MMTTLTVGISTFITTSVVDDIRLMMTFLRPVDDIIDDSTVLCRIRSDISVILDIVVR